MQPQKTKSSHHHGHLRIALVQAGIELLEEGGASALTLRRCAARAGVSHGAPAYHFKGVAGLLAAIAAAGYRKFTDTMIEERGKVGPDPRARLEAVCEGYLRFSRENEALFILMFSQQKLDFSEEELIIQSRAAYQVLAQGCAPFRHGEAGRAGTEIMVWSLVHGFAMLSLRQRAAPADRVGFELNFSDILPPLQLKKPEN